MCVRTCVRLCLWLFVLGRVLGLRAVGCGLWACAYWSRRSCLLGQALFVRSCVVLYVCACVRVCECVSGWCLG